VASGADSADDDGAPTQALRAVIGIARTDGTDEHFSGVLIIAFATGNWAMTRPTLPASQAGWIQPC